MPQSDSVDLRGNVQAPTLQVAGKYAVTEHGILMKNIAD